MGVVLCYGYVVLVMMLACAIKKYGEEYSRKFVHIMTANWWLIAMVFCKSIWGPLFISLCFLLVNSIGYRYKLFSQIELSERDPGLGTIYYSISMILLVLMSYFLEDNTIGLVGCMILGYGDGLAAIIGKKYPIYNYKIRGHYKSLGGSMTMFWVSIGVVGLALMISKRSWSLVLAVSIGLLSTFLEAIAIKGRDNLWVPLGSACLYVLALGI